MFNFWLLKELLTLDVSIFELKGHSGSADKKLNRVEHHYQYHGPGNISSGWNCNNRICPCDVIMWVIGWWGGVSFEVILRARMTLRSMGWLRATGPYQQKMTTMHVVTLVMHSSPQPWVSCHLHNVLLQCVVMAFQPFPHYTS